MKKFILACSVAAMMVGAASCGSGSSESPTSDSLSVIAGNSMGADINRQLQMYLAQQSDSARKAFSKEDFLRGFEAAMGVDTANQSYVMGYQVGLNGWQFLMRQNQTGVKVNAQKFIEAFKSQFMKDSISAEEGQKYQQEFQAIMTQMQQEQIRKAQEAKAKSPEAIANKNAGEAFVKKQKAADPAIQTSQSGLSYKIESEGNGPKVQRTDKVKIKYVGKLVDGKEFDKNDNVELTAGNFVPGFTEGLMLLGKGGKATLYIPGELAYGVDGIPQAGIGPNSTLVFDVEVLDIIPADAEGAAPMQTIEVQ